MAGIDWVWGAVSARTEPAAGEGRGTVVSREAGQLRADVMVRNGRLLRGAGYAEAPAVARREVARAAALLRLRARGKYVVHGAGAVEPVGRGWVLLGPTGSGKSTLAYALARAGWPILGDDMVVLAPAGPTPETTHTVVVHGWHEPLRVSLDLAPRFPELAAAAAEHAVGDPRRRVPVAARMAGRAPLAGLLFLTRGVRDVATRIAPAAALAALIPQSPWVLLDDGHARRHLAALAGVTSSVPAFRLEHTAAALEADGGIATLIAGLDPTRPVAGAIA